MLKGAIAPFVAAATAAATAAALAWAGGRSETYSLSNVYHCGRALTQADLPAADILFVGNSQTGAAIDPAYVARLIDPHGSVRVERLAILQGHVVALRMLVEDYVERRGAPGTVVLQPMVVRAEHWQEPAGRPVHPRSNLAFQPWNELVEVQRNARFAPDASGLPHWIHAGYRTLPAVYIDRTVGRIAAALSYLRLAPVKAACQSEMKFRQSSIWPYGSLPLTGDIRSRFVTDAEQRAHWNAEIRKRRPAMPNDPERTFEIDQHLRLLTLLRSAGSRVVLVGYPNYSSAKDDARVHAEFGQALGQEVIDAHSLLSADEQSALPALFRDPFHLSFAGAEIVSRRLAEVVSERRQ